MSSAQACPILPNPTTARRSGSMDVIVFDEFSFLRRKCRGALSNGYGAWIAHVRTEQVKCLAIS
jgi:hypothetical protein